jgi:general secretion pathway protein E
MNLTHLKQEGLLRNWIQACHAERLFQQVPEKLELCTTAEDLVALARALKVQPDKLNEALATSLGLPWQASLAGMIPSAEFIDRFPIGLARDGKLLGFEKKNGVMPLALGGWESIEQIDGVSRFFQCRIEPFFAPVQQIETAINAAWQQRDSQTTETIESLDSSGGILTLSASNREDLLDSSGRSPVIRLVNSILFDAVLARASDIHIQPTEDTLDVRFRIDGVLFDQFKVPRASQEEVLSRIKIIGEMNIAEKRLSQDGRASVQIGDRLIDLRIASLPTSHGERIVIRLLDKSARLYTLEELGMPPLLLSRFRKLIHLEHGLILVTGPTGGGKSTTLYAGLQEINTNYSNIVTLEDPIEYQLPGISQTQISEKKGLTFADGLRSVLRQDPDVIMVGEIRDQATANMAIQSALTGHMVFSTLHTNDAPSAINRLLDLGVEPYLVASSLIGVLAQRLVRRICKHCKQPAPELADQLSQFGEVPDSEVMPCRGTGCAQCRETGYQGRLGVFEFMEVQEETRSLIQNRANASEIREASRAKGMKLLSEDGLTKILAGETTVEEVIRVSMQV